MQQLAALIEKLDPAEYEKLLEQVEEYRRALERERAQVGFMEYVKLMWPGFVGGRHHALMAKKFEAIAEGKNTQRLVDRLVELGVLKKVRKLGRTIRPVYINFRNLE